MASAKDVSRRMGAAAYAVIDYFQASENTVLIVLATFVGILGGLGAVGFRALISGVQMLTIGQGGTTILERLNELPWYYLLALPVLGGAVVGPLIHFFAREAKGHGVPEVMEAVALHGGRIRPRLVIFKSLASAITIATGGSVGREGPIVQVGSAIGSTFGTLLRMPPERLRVLVGCGAAAGIAATFNAPVAGVLFAIELILGNYAITTLTPLIISSVGATVVCYAFPSITGGNMRAFHIPVVYELVSAWEIPLFAVLGVVAGLVALAFVVLTYASEDAFDALPVPPYVKPAIGGLILGGLFLANQRLLGSVHCYGIGYQTIEIIMNGDVTWTLLFGLLVFKLLATPLTLGSGASGGVFAPSLFIGAVTGGAFGAVVNMLFPGHTGPIGAYALVGMAAVVAGSTHAPIMAILMLFELTGDYQIILPVMICCVISSLLTSRLKKDSIYTQKLSRRGVNLSKGLEATIMDSTRVVDVMRTTVPTVHEEEPFEGVLSRLLDDRILQLYVVDGEEKLKGLVSLNDVKGVINEEGLGQVLVAADLMETTFPVLEPSSTLAECVVKLGASPFEELPIIEQPQEGDEVDGKILGVVTSSDVFQLYNHEVLKRGTLGLKFIHRDPVGPRSDYVEMPPDHQVSVIAVTSKLAGQTLSELDLRKRYRVNVVAIRSRHAPGAKGDSDVPDPMRKLRRTDSLIVTGIQSDIDELKKAYGS